MSSFPITLISNVQSQQAHENKMNHFFTKLHKRLEFDGEWEVGISRVIITKSWYNISENQKIMILFKGHVKEKDVQAMSPKEFPAGNYDNIEDIILRINYIIEQALSEIKGIKFPQLRYNSVYGKTILEPGLMLEKIEVRIKLQDLLCNIIGYDNDIKEDTYADLNAGMHALYIYSNIVEHTAVGNTSSQLLGIVEVDSHIPFGHNIIKTYNTPEYYPLSSNLIDTVETLIVDDNNEKIRFLFGRVMIQLRCRRMQ